jgi:secretion/DNA translocation related TadE-like protein
MTRRRTDRGSASLWVLACCALLMAVAFAATLRGTAVLARHRAESAADLAALAAAGQIGVSAAICSAATKVAAANGTVVTACSPTLRPDGRSGTVTVRLILRVRLPVLGGAQVVASARAGREAVPP